MKNFLFLGIVYAVITLSGCRVAESGYIPPQNTPIEEETLSPQSLHDPRFVGTFLYAYSRSDDDGNVVNFNSDMFVFDGTTKAKRVLCIYTYHEDGDYWTYTGDYVGDIVETDIEVDTDILNFKYKLWDISISPWNTYGYSFSDHNNILTLEGYAYFGDADFVRQ